MRKPEYHKKVDLASVVVLIIGVIFGIVSYWLIESEGFNVVIIIPSVLAAGYGAANLTKIEAR